MENPVSFLEKMTREAELLFGLACWVIAFSIIGFLTRPKKRTFTNLVVSLFVSVPTGILIGAICREFGLGDWLSTGIACFTAIMANDVIVLMLSNPEAVVRWIGIKVDSIFEKISNRWLK